MGLLDTFLIRGSDKPYCTSAQLALFKKARDGGQTSFFRASNCGTCRAEVPNSKTFCSIECWENSKEKS